MKTVDDFIRRGCICVDGVITDGMFSLHLAAPPAPTTAPSLSHFLARSVLTDVRLGVRELLTVCLAEWIVSGHSTLCPAITSPLGSSVLLK